MDFKSVTLETIPEDWTDDQKAFARAAIEARDSSAAHIARINKESQGRRQKLDIVEAKAKEAGYESIEDFMSGVKVVDDDPQPADLDANPAVQQLKKTIEAMQADLKRKDEETANERKLRIERGRDATLLEAINKRGISKENAEAALRLLRTDPSLSVDAEGKVTRKTKDQYGADVEEAFSEGHIDKMLPPVLLPAAGGPGSGGRPSVGSFGDVRGKDVNSLMSTQGDFDKNRAQIIERLRQSERAVPAV